jgi:hypothetical protein
MEMILKPLGPEVSIATANTVSNSNLVRIINTGAAAVLHLANTGGEYANITVSNLQYIVIQKANADTLTGANMLACPVAYKY